MANTCYSRLVISGKGFKKFLEKLTKKEDNCYSIFDSLVPVPEHILNSYEQPYTYYYGSNTLDYDTTLIEESDNRLVFNIDWSNAPGFDGLNKVAEMFPELTFKLIYKEPKACYKGFCLWKNGEMTESEEVEDEDYDEDEREKDLEEAEEGEGITIIVD